MHCSKKIADRKKWCSLDEVCEEFRIKDSDIEFTVPQAADILEMPAVEIRRLIKTNRLCEKTDDVIPSVSEESLESIDNSILEIPHAASLRSE